MGHITPAACLRRIGRYAIVAIGLAGLINPASAQTTLTPTQTLSAAREAHRVESGQKFFGDAKYAGSDSCKSCHEKQYGEYARIAAKYPLGQHEFHINYGVAGSLSTTPSSGATQATLAYNYNLTDKTKIYSFITRIRNQANASYHFLNDTPDGAYNSSVAIGVRHNF